MADFYINWLNKNCQWGFCDQYEEPGYRTNLQTIAKFVVVFAWHSRYHYTGQTGWPFMGGWYRVVKTIKGHRYIYEQQTWREGDHVRTRNRYIGRAVDSQGGSSASRGGSGGILAGTTAARASAP